MPTPMRRDVGRDIAQFRDGARHLRRQRVAFERGFAAFQHAAVLRHERGVQRRAGDIDADIVCCRLNGTCHVLGSVSNEVSENAHRREARAL